MIELALNMDWQKRMQTDLDRIFGGCPISSWDYDSHFENLFGGVVGATLNESESSNLEARLGFTFSADRVFIRAQADI